jgi:hypothetical protein
LRLVSNVVSMFCLRVTSLVAVASGLGLLHKWFN